MENNDPIKLPEKLTRQQLGMSNNAVAKLVKRNGDVCWYQRSDGVHEVVIIQVRHDENGQLREYYPNMKDFGVSAWNFLKPERAMRKFKELCNASNDGYYR